MKKLCTLFVCLLICGFSQAQIELWLGPRAGVNFANVSEVEGDGLTSFYAGVAFAVNFSERYSLQPELGFSLQGAKDIAGTSNDMNLNYLTFGIINKLYLVEGFHVLAGPEINFKVNDTFSDWVYYDEDEEDFYLQDDDIQPFDFMIVGGLGYDLPMGLSFEARYKQGLLDVKDFFNYDGKSSLNQVFQLGVVYKFQLNK